MVSTGNAASRIFFHSSVAPGAVAAFSVVVIVAAALMAAAPARSATAAQDGPAAGPATATATAARPAAPGRPPSEPPLRTSTSGTARDTQAVRNDPPPVSAYGTIASPDTCRPYIFAWPFLAGKDMQPRGGSTRGAAVTPIAGPSENWKRLRSAGSDAFRRDRAAILAMAGDYRASFDFLETAVFTPGKQASPARPYRSWGTERIHVAADSGSFISLQHIMVMFFEDDKGVRQGPMVMKHWRQDWRYEPRTLSEHRGRGLWVRRALGRGERKGAWSQSVYHVDDSPRYASLGRWEHNAAFSAWTGGTVMRPLPRREHTVRSDYQVLEGRNRHTILPTGWLHEQDNLKQVLGPDGAADTALPYLAREAGVDRYDLIQGFDFSAGDAYWESTGAFWARVRARWDRILDASPRLRIAEDCRGEPAFAAFFALADSSASPKPPPRRDMDRNLDSLFSCIAAKEAP